MSELPLHKFDSTCVRKLANFSKSDKSFKFDSEDFSPKDLNEVISNRSPKLEELLDKIKRVDAADLKRDGHNYKHFIFCDIKSSNQGARMLASAFIANGYNMGYTAEPKPPKKKANGDDAKPKKEKRFNKIEMHSDGELNKTKSENFFLLSSTDVYDQPVSVAMKKQILAKYNERPANIHGEQIRFIIMDSGFKEGIDLFDIKYVHIFEPPVNAADQKQVIGRGTRTCGQSGLTFHPTQGWPLHVYIYDIAIPDRLQSSFLKSTSAFDLYLKSMNIDVKLMKLSAEIEELSVYGSVDYELNRPVHEFKINGGSAHSSGGAMPKEFIVTHKSMRQYVNHNFPDAKWTDVKMENLCESKKKGGANVIQFTPTQRFVRDYFTPQCPVKGMLLWHSTGTGKTCSAIASATSSFDPQGYTILWVTRTTLKNDIWKNMFDQICNEQIRRMVSDGITLPEAHSKRMRMLSKAWKIRPISYKQFSNLVSKDNNYYDKLVNINGKEDPLKKTLLIIDEAHKLYGGGDLSSLERPDMKALHASLMNSYAVSGKDSVRVLLMTATPITENPMEVVKLVNLCKPISEQMPEEFPVFSNKYLTEEGSFSASGKTQYLDNIAGHISFLTREKDARQFAQPLIEYVKVPITEDKNITDMDKRYARFTAGQESTEMKKLIEEFNEEIKKEFSDIEKSRFNVLKDVCNDYEGAVKKGCLKVAKGNISQLVKEARVLIKEIKGKIKDIRTTMKGKTNEKQKILRTIKQNTDQDPVRFQKFKESVYFILKYKCGKTAPKNVNVADFIKTHPLVLEHKNELVAYDVEIEKLDDDLKLMVDAYQSKMKNVKKLLRSVTDMSVFEKLAVKLSIKDMRKEHNKTMKQRSKTIKVVKKELMDEKKNIKKDFKSTMKQVNREFKTHQSDLKKQEKIDTKQAKQELKIQRNLSDVREEFKEGPIKELVKTHTENIKAELVEIKVEIAQKENMKKDAKDAKAKVSAEKKEEKAKVSAEKKEEKAKVSAEKKEEKAKVSAEKKVARAAETQRKRELKALNKTKKNRT